MKFWGKQTEAPTLPRSVARLAVEGASQEDLLHAALETLAGDGRATRVGVWFEPEIPAQINSWGQASFRGAVWDEENDTVPAEWSQLSPELPLPQELISGGKTVEQELDESGQVPLFGPLVELRRAVWVPIEGKGRLRGVLLAGTRRKQNGLPRELAESLAAELALALGFEEQQRIARERQADTHLARQTFAALGNGALFDTVLADLAASCTVTDKKENGAGATFAVIGAVRGNVESMAEFTQLEFHWKGGDLAWTNAVASEPLAGIWRRALEARRVIGSEPGISWSKGEVARIVALPLEAHKQILGALVVGLPAGTASLATLDRLELRASLATLALERRKQSREEAEQAARQRALLEGNSEAVVLLDQQSMIVALSSGARGLLGESAQKDHAYLENLRPHEHFSELFRSRDRESMESWSKRRITSVLDGKSVAENPPEVDLRNGVKVRIRQVVPAANGFATVTLEPLQRQQGGLSAERSETELRSVIEWLEEGVVLFDARENVRAVNTRFEQLTGIGPEESGKYQTLDEWIERVKSSAAEPEIFAERWHELARGIEGGVREELQMVRPVPRILERAARTVLDGVGRKLGRLEIYRDLTAQRVFQSKLLQTEKLAALGQMVTGVAHELSNPLTSILGYAQRLLLREDSAGKSTEARQIFQEAERAGGILRQLLFTAREAPPERRPVALNQIVQRTMELQRFGIAGEKVHIELDLDPVLPNVHGDAGQLQQVLMNLIGNARQAIEQHGKGGVIRLRTKRTGEKRVLLEVSDDGPGIPQAILARIFDPFFTTKPAGVGTGLGLAIVLSIVREHGGSIQVSNFPGGGATFSIELPVGTAALSQKDEEPYISSTSRFGLLPSERHAREYPAGPPVAQRPTANHSRVLVVEDEPTVARLIADVLEDEGHRVDVLLDGREALERAAREQFDLVICDMKMPGIDGQHFYKTLARTGNPLSNRFLFVTGDVIAPHTHEFLERNHLPHVAKPFRMEELTDKVRRVLGSKVHQKSSSAAVRKNVAGNG